MQWNRLERRPGTTSRLLAGLPRVALGLLRPLLRARRSVRRHRGHLRLRRPGGRRGRARQRLGDPVPPREVRDRRAWPSWPTSWPAARRRRPAGSMELCPAIDLRGRRRRCAWSRATSTARRDYGDPVDLARRFVAGGARWLHVVDLDAARTGEPVQPPGRGSAIAAAGPGCRSRAGGGVRTAARRRRAAGGRRGPGGARHGGGGGPGPGRRPAPRRHPGRVAVGLDYRRGPTGSLEAAVAGLDGRVGAHGRRASLGRRRPGRLAAVVVTAIDRDGTLVGPGPRRPGGRARRPTAPAGGGLGRRRLGRATCGPWPRLRGRRAVGRARPAWWWAGAGRRPASSVEEAIAACAPSG